MTIPSSTWQTVVALRNNDGAKLHHVLVENVRDGGGEYEPWGIVRIGENNYFCNRPNALGETHDITVRNIRSRAKGTVYLSASLSDSYIGDIEADGGAMYAVSTYQPTYVTDENGCTVSGGVTMKNVLFETIRYDGTAAHKNDALLTDVDVPFDGCALDFRRMRDTDTLENVRFRGIAARDGSELFLVKDGITLDIE